MKITTAQGFEIVRLINKLEMKKEITETITMFQKSVQGQEQANIKIRLLIEKRRGCKIEELTDEDAKIEIENILAINDGLRGEMQEAQSTKLEIIGNLIMTLLTRIPIAEKEFYKCIAKIHEKKESDIAKMDISEVKTLVMQIAQSESFKSFFSLAMR